jgi:hypothetical protein
MSANMKERRATARRLKSEFRGNRAAIERRRAPSRIASGDATDRSASPITLSVMRAMVAAADALRAHAEAHGTGALTAAPGSRARVELATKRRWYQAASRNFIKDWLHNVGRTSWLVDAGTGRSLHAPSAAPAGADWIVALAEDQSMHGLRERFVRDGLGIPVVVRPRGADAEQSSGATAAAPRTAIISVDPDVDRRVRTVRVELKDPESVAVVGCGGIDFPLAADFSAPVAQTLGLGRKPAAVAYGIRDAARRGSVEGFTALTPSAPGRAPLVLMEGVGLSPLMMAQIANEVAGDTVLRERYQVWLYRYATTTPLLFAAHGFRADLERFHALVERVSGGDAGRRAVVVGHGAGAAIAASVRHGSGAAIWDAVFATPLHKIEMSTADRASLEALFFWEPSTRIRRVAVVAGSGYSDALAAGVGDRALRLLQRQSPEFRTTLERMYRTLKRYVRPLAHAPVSPAWLDGSEQSDPVREALAAAAIAADRALLARAANGGAAVDARAWPTRDNVGNSGTRAAATG